MAIVVLGMVVMNRFAHFCQRGIKALSVVPTTTDQRVVRDSTHSMVTCHAAVLCTLPVTYLAQGKVTRNVF